LLDMSTTAQINDSLKLGSALLGEIGNVGKLHKGQVEQAGFAVLKAPDIPSVLVETAFISNPEEEAEAAQRRLPGAAGRCAGEATRFALAAVLLTSTIHRRFRPLNAGCTPGSSGNQRQRRSGDATCAQPRWRRLSDAVSPGEPGVQPALTGVKGRWLVLVIGTAARAQRVASGRRTKAALNSTHGAWCSCAVQRLSFGDFSLAPQRKVTRPRGADSRGTASSL
jgi:hypothetical protein